jgi:hypothetical protein
LLKVALNTKNKIKSTIFILKYHGQTIGKLYKLSTCRSVGIEIVPP